MMVASLIRWYITCALILNIHSNKQQANQSPGAQLYTKYCLTCHQADGGGVRNMFPPLAGNPKITGPSADIIKIVLNGLKGPIVVNERDYNQVMPPQNYLDDKQIADILSYVRNEWGNKASPVKPEEVAKARAGK
jgi:aldose sugar dehydrogenase